MTTRKSEILFEKLLERMDEVNDKLGVVKEEIKEEIELAFEFGGSLEKLADQMEYFEELLMEREKRRKQIKELLKEIT